MISEVFYDRQLLRFLTVTVAVLTLFPVAHALTTQRRGLKATGDILGTIYSPPPPEGSPNGGGFNDTKALLDHAHFYSAAEILTRWAETTFALTAEAQKLLSAQPNGPTGSACVYDGKLCLFNPLNAGAPAFPAPQHESEIILKRFSIEAFMCRGAADRATCHLDSKCDWDGNTNACHLAHDPHSDFTRAIAQCQDTVYSAHARVCWRRKPHPENWRPCGGGSCRQYGAKDGLPEDRCMSEKALGSRTPAELYALFNRFYSSTFMERPDEIFGDSDRHIEDVQFQREGFGTCSNAELHYLMKTTCRHESREACLQDSKCSWMSGIIRGEFCVLSKERTIEALMGGSVFTQTVLKAEKACLAANTAAGCMQVPLILPQRQRQL